tara:strand:- start:276 stop:968 length:693 start_codon:yes stop_codon:yes gene_type:complete
MIDSLSELHRLNIPHLYISDLDMDELSPQDKHHLLNVRRLKIGQRITVTDGKGTWQECEITKSTLKQISDRYFCENYVAKSSIHIALTKSGKPELVTQKLTELGVTSIQFFFSERSIPQWDESKTLKKLRKLKTISKQALAQSKGVWLPRLNVGARFEELVAEEGMFMADRRGERLTEGVRKIMIGPEGGWGESEYEYGAKKIRIHELNLRAETAAIAVATLMSSSFPKN